MNEARPLGFSTLSVLHAIARGVEYGFDLCDQTGLPSGTVYPALSRLEEQGLVRSQWEAAEIAQRDKRPARRYYAITAAGQRALQTSLAHYRRLQPVRSATAGARTKPRGSTGRA
jgi:DNA-binding PadR family transcriptional regulator